MLDLELTNCTATLEGINLRTEKIGPDRIPAADLKITVPTEADVLAYFSPTLKAFLFDVSGPKDLADGISVRDMHLDYPLGRDEEMFGATVWIGYGVGDPMHFPDCKLNAFKITPREGGVVILGFRVQCRPSPEQVAKLYTLQEQGIELTLEPAELPEMKAA